MGGNRRMAMAVLPGGSIGLAGLAGEAAGQGSRTAALHKAVREQDHAEARKLYEQAEKLRGEGKPAEAGNRFTELRARYPQTTWAAKVSAMKQAGAFDPYHRWLGIPPGEQPPDDYRLLGLARFEDAPEVIEAAADQRMAFLRSVQTGPRGPLSQKLLNEVAAAKVRLLNTEKKAEYDRQLREEEAAERAETPQAAPVVPRAVAVPAGEDASELPRISSSSGAERRSSAVGWTFLSVFGERTGTSILRGGRGERRVKWMLGAWWVLVPAPSPPAAPRPPARASGPDRGGMHGGTVDAPGERRELSSSDDGRERPSYAGAMRPASLENWDSPPTRRCLCRPSRRRTRRTPWPGGSSTRPPRRPPARRNGTSCCGWPRSWAPTRPRWTWCWRRPAGWVGRSRSIR